MDGEDDPDEGASSPPTGFLWWLRFVGSVLGRFWLTLVIGGTLIATLPAALPGWSAYVVKSGSMEPKIMIGDVVIVQRRSDYTDGQVVTFHNPALEGALTTHRLVSIHGDSVTTKGDANVSDDPRTSVPSDIVGLGRIKVGWIGLPMIWLQQHHWVPFLLFWLSVAGAVAAWRSDPELIPHQPRHARARTARV
ncbi:signal peptidase I [Nakamurella sp. UYEF19]|uniref:signal peptidase I n=1 Tax=Nakamurella sp. UYEF19 TaxID=1756392 RepID=UPI00339A0745